MKLTPSRIREFEGCPLQYKRLHLENLGPQNPVPSKAYAFGCSLHAALDDLHRPGTGPRTLDPEALLRRNWRRGGYANDEEEAAYFNKGTNALAAYGARMLVPIGHILGTEVFLSRKIALSGRRFELGCKADRLELLPNGTLEVLDYKTNGNGEIPSTDVLAGDLPTFVYYALARISYPAYSRVVVSQLNVLTLAKTLVDYAPEQVAANKSALVELVDKIGAGQFEPRPNGRCTWCSVKSYCPLFGLDASLDELN